MTELQLDFWVRWDFNAYFGREKFVKTWCYCANFSLSSLSPQGSLKAVEEMQTA